MQDIRIYKYNKGVLVKPKSRYLKHTYNSLEAARDRLSNYENLRTLKAQEFSLKKHNKEQYIITEYIGYDSHILETVTL